MRVPRRVIAVAAAVALLGGCASQVNQASPAASTPNAPAPSGPSAPSPPSQPSAYLLGGLDTDQPCTATLADAPRLENLGIALQDVAQMTVDPVDLGLGGDGWYRSSAYADNYEFEESWDEACSAAKRFGRLTGHMRRAVPTGPEDTAAQLQEDASLFQTPEGADAWLSWFAALPAEQGMTRTVEDLPGIGDRAILTTVTGGTSEGSVAVLRRGRVVGHVYVWGDAGKPSIADVRVVAAALDEQIASVKPTGEPVDLVATMSAPVPRTVWGDAFSAWAWDYAGYAGGRDNQTFVESASDPAQARDLVEDYGRLAGYQATFGAPEAPGWVATGTTIYRDAASAAGALDRIVGDKLKGARSGTSPATQFEVPGIPGATGLVQSAEGELVTEVYFVRGPNLARTFRVRQPGTEGEDDRALVSDVAQQFAQRLEDLLG